MTDWKLKIKRAKQKLQSECKNTLWWRHLIRNFTEHHYRRVPDKQSLQYTDTGKYIVIDRIYIRNLNNINFFFFFFNQSWGRKYVPMNRISYLSCFKVIFPLGSNDWFSRHCWTGSVSHSVMSNALWPHGQ